MKTESTPSRLAESLRRYLPAEAAGLFTAAAAGLVFLALTGSQTPAAVGAAWGENAGYYGMIAVRDFRGHRTLRPRPLAYTMGNLLVEFGPAEALDSLLLRPALMFAGLALNQPRRWPMSSTWRSKGSTPRSTLGEWPPESIWVAATRG